MTTPSPLIERLTADMEAAMRSTDGATRTGTPPAVARRTRPLLFAMLACLGTIAVVGVAVWIVARPDREQIASPAQQSSDPSKSDTRDASGLSDVPPTARPYRDLVRDGDAVPADSPAARTIRNGLANNDGEVDGSTLMRQVALDGEVVVVMGFSDDRFCFYRQAAPGEAGWWCAEARDSTKDRPRLLYTNNPEQRSISTALASGTADVRLHYPMAPRNQSPSQTTSSASTSSRCPSVSRTAARTEPRARCRSAKPPQTPLTTRYCIEAITIVGAGLHGSAVLP